MSDAPSRTASRRSTAYEVYHRRDVPRTIRPHLHLEGDLMGNFYGELEDMLAARECLSEREVRLLSHLSRCSWRHAYGEPTGGYVTMSDRQWSAFLGIRFRVRLGLSPGNSTETLQNLTAALKAKYAKTQDTDTEPKDTTR